MTQTIESRKKKVVVEVRKLKIDKKSILKLLSSKYYLLRSIIYRRKVLCFARRATSTHAFTARTTQVSNLLRSPSCRASASGVGWFLAFALDVPDDINAFHCYTVSSRNPANPLVYPSLDLYEVKPRNFNQDAINRLRDSLRPVNSDNACALRITATAGT